MRTKFSTLLILGLIAAGNAYALERTAAPEGASLYFIDLKDNQTVEQELVVRFGLRGMGVAP
ncbi:MAG: rod shape-determining protein RodA, partial [Xanthomonadales bacterium]|nr:rod shape-determining protein RodA [Xanthomonadales bacterium]